MTDQLSLDQFVELTLNVAGDDEEFVPTFVNPEARDIKALEGVPLSVDAAEIVRNWAANQGASHYFIAYPNGAMIVAEEYENGALIGAQDFRANQQT